MQSHHAGTNTARLVDVGSTRLYVEQRGPAGGLPVVVLHGGGQQDDQGGPQQDDQQLGDRLDPLTGSYRLLLVDQRGQGRSDHDCHPSTRTLETMADDVSRLVAVLGETRYAVFGHSAGALVALQHACDAPGAALATIVSAAESPTEAIRGRLRSVPQPVLVLAGRHDPAGSPAEAEDIAAAVRNGRCVIFENSGPLVFADEPERFREVVRGFLDGISDTGWDC